MVQLEVAMQRMVVSGGIQLQRAVRHGDLLHIQLVQLAILFLVAACAKKMGVALLQ